MFLYTLYWRSVISWGFSRHTETFRRYDKLCAKNTILILVHLSVSFCEFCSSLLGHRGLRWARSRSQIWYASPSKHNFKVFNNTPCNRKILKIHDTLYTFIRAVENFSMLCTLRKAFCFCGMKNPGHGVGYINYTSHMLYCKLGLVYCAKFLNDKFGLRFGRYKVFSSYK